MRQEEEDKSKSNDQQAHYLGTLPNPHPNPHPTHHPNPYPYPKPHPNPYPEPNPSLQGLMSELFGLTQGNPEAHAAVLRHIRRAKLEAIEIRTKQGHAKDQQEVFYSSNLPFNTQARSMRGGREWIK